MLKPVVMKGVFGEDVAVERETETWTLQYRVSDEAFAKAACGGDFAAGMAALLMRRVKAEPQKDLFLDPAQRYYEESEHERRRAYQEYLINRPLTPSKKPVARGR